MRMDTVGFLAMCAVLVTGGCNNHSPVSIENTEKTYRVMVFDRTCVQYLLIGMGNGQAGLGPIIDKDGRPVLDKECVYKQAANAASDGEE